MADAVTAVSRPILRKNQSMASLQRSVRVHRGKSAWDQLNELTGVTVKANEEPVTSWEVKEWDGPKCKGSSSMNPSSPPTQYSSQSFADLLFLLPPMFDTVSNFAAFLLCISLGPLDLTETQPEQVFSDGAIRPRQPTWRARLRYLFNGLLRNEVNKWTCESVE